MAESEHVTYQSSIEGLIWRENINGPINWGLEDKDHLTYPKSGWPYHKCYGDVATTWNGKFATLLPAIYNEETDSDAYSIGEFDSLSEAMEAVEANINLSLAF